MERAMPTQNTESKEVHWNRPILFMGLDWARDHHNAVVLDRKGTIVLDLPIEHTSEGWHRLREKLIQIAGAELSVIAATIETHCGPAVERLLARGVRFIR